uniref:KTSC domain-containing protein n=1 Tax=Caenorhabditis tropicalis TaxID=1561998 RepID=A0A1I7UC43_9PELO
MMRVDVTSSRLSYRGKGLRLSKVIMWDEKWTLYVNYTSMTETYVNYTSMTESPAIFDSKLREFYRKGIEQLPIRWQYTVDHDGAYYVN